MRAKVLKVFSDSKANKIRGIGEEFEVNRERFENIIKADKENPFIELIKEDSEEVDENLNDELSGIGDKKEYPKHVGGGYYELSNGEKVKGKDEALKVEEALKQSTQEPPNN